MADEKRREPEGQPESAAGSEHPAPRRIVSLEDLATRATISGKAAEENQMRVAAQTIPEAQKFAPAVIGSAQLIAATLLHCTLALCERLDKLDQEWFMAKVDKHNRRGMN